MFSTLMSVQIALCPLGKEGFFFLLFFFQDSRKHLLFSSLFFRLLPKASCLKFGTIKFKRLFQKATLPGVFETFLAQVKVQGKVT